MGYCRGTNEPNQKDTEISVTLEITLDELCIVSIIGYCGIILITIVIEASVIDRYYRNKEYIHAILIYK